MDINFRNLEVSEANKDTRVKPEAGFNQSYTS